MDFTSFFREIFTGPNCWGNGKYFVSCYVDAKATVHFPVCKSIEISFNARLYSTMLSFEQHSFFNEVRSSGDRSTENPASRSANVE